MQKPLNSMQKVPRVNSSGTNSFRPIVVGMPFIRFVLIALPAFVARTATVLALGTGVALLLMMFRLADLGHDREEPAEELQGEDHGTLELA